MSNRNDGALRKKHQRKVQRFAGEGQAETIAAAAPGVFRVLPFSVAGTERQRVPGVPQSRPRGGALSNARQDRVFAHGTPTSAIGPRRSALSELVCILRQVE